MRVLIINSVCGIRSTGRICTDIAEQYIREGHECKIAYGREQVPKKYEDISYRIGNEFAVRINALKTRLFDNEGFNAKRETKRFLKWADSYNPDVLWLHNLHGYYLNIEMLFEWIKKRPQMEIKWTLHDCWAFTGHCSHFSYVKCNKWKTGCKKCCQKRQYPLSFIFDRSRENYIKKKKLFSGIEKMKIITPSHWLANLVRESFLNEYDVIVEYNKINKLFFERRNSNFRNKYNIQGQKVVLGVATAWNNRKGLNDFIELSKIIDSSYIIVLVGLSKKQIKRIPSNILCIERTNDVNELAEIYSEANVFLNLSVEETFGLTTLEAASCGTKVIVYKDTACEEVASFVEGDIAEKGNLTELCEMIYKVVE